MISISDSLSAPTSVDSVSPSISATPARKPEEDTVKLSQAAQVHLLRQQGDTLYQIALNLNIPLATVNGYLGTTVPTSTSA